jgi:hypothetical protein
MNIIIIFYGFSIMIYIYPSIVQSSSLTIPGLALYWARDDAQTEEQAEILCCLVGSTARIRICERCICSNGEVMVGWRELKYL